MKRILVMAVAAMMVTLSAKAQYEEGDFTIQPRVGISMSNITNWDDAKMKTSVAFGMEFERFFNDKFSVAAGLLYTNQGAKWDDEDGKSTLHLHYGLIPITANYYVLPGLALKAGIQPGFRVKAGANIDGTKIDFDKFLEAEFPNKEVKMSTFDFAIPVGLSYELYHITLDARFNIGLTKLITGIDESVRNQVIVITLGYKFN